MDNYTEEPQPFCFRLRSLLYSLLRKILIKHHQGSPAANQSSIIQTRANQISIVKYFMQRTTYNILLFTNFGILFKMRISFARSFSVNSLKYSIKQMQTDEMLSDEMTYTNVSN